MKSAFMYLIFFFQISLAGEMHSGGADQLVSAKNYAWFTGIGNEVCIHINPNFGVSEKEILAVTRRSFEIWKEYVVLRKIPRNSKIQLGVDPILKTACSNNEILTIFFGIENEKIKKERKLYNDPIAMEKMESFDEKKSSGKGFIWIANSGARHSTEFPNFPNWKLESNLQGILLHEIGHMYGIGHTEGTIMKTNIVEDIKKNIQFQFNHIDQSNTLIETFSDFLIEGSIFGLDDPTRTIEIQGHDVINDGKDTFKRLMGRNLEGEVVATIRRKYIMDANFPRIQINLTLKDDLGSKDFKLNFPGDRSFENAFFFTEEDCYMRILGTNGFTCSFKPKPFVLHGSMRDIAGKEYIITYEQSVPFPWGHNFQVSPYMINILIPVGFQLRKRNLFIKEYRELSRDFLGASIDNSSRASFSPLGSHN